MVNFKGVIFTFFCSSVEQYNIYIKRQSIKAFIKNGETYHIKNLRTKEFDSIHAFLWIVFITHNLLSWIKGTVLSGTKLENVGTKTLVDKLGSIVGEELKFTLIEIGQQGSVFAYVASNLPEGAVINSQTGEFSWTPTYVQIGVYIQKLHFK